MDNQCITRELSDKLLTNQNKSYTGGFYSPIKSDYNEDANHISNESTFSNREGGKSLKRKTQNIGLELMVKKVLPKGLLFILVEFNLIFKAKKGLPRRPRPRR